MHKEETIKQFLLRIYKAFHAFCPCIFYILIAVLVGCSEISPTAAFSAKPTAGEAPCVIEFTDLSYVEDEWSTTFLWEFGDGWISTEKNPKHVYAEPGTYSVVLTVELFGKDDSASRQGYITITPPASRDIPSIVDFSINDGAAESPGCIITLVNTCTEKPSHYMVSELPSFAGAVWFAYTPTTTLILSSGNGYKEVYFKVKNELGESQIVSASIFLNESDETRRHQAGDTVIHGGIMFVWCPPGTFAMGSPEDEQDRLDHEGPQHLVTLTHGFWMGKYEVTTSQWASLMGSGTSTGKVFGHDTPCLSLKTDNLNETPAANHVSWNDTQEFLTRLNQQFPENGFRLPTEAEWEYACRCATTTRFYWGDDPAYTDAGNYEWFTPFYDDDRDSSDWRSSHGVGRKYPNSWGLYDMGGNVKEWCQDWYGEYTENVVIDPEGPSLGTFRVLRGGSSVFTSAEDCRSACRSGAPEDERYSNVGFRIAMNP